jgi:hypothetical protein
MKIFSILGVILVILISRDALACDPMLGYEKFNPKPTGDSGRIDRPDIELISLDRGDDDGNPASCSDVGRLEFRVSPDLAIGYRFRLVEGHLPKNLLPEFPLRPKPHIRDKIWFVWVDDPRWTDAVLEAVIEVRAVSLQGVWSDPVLIEISESEGPENR